MLKNKQAGYNESSQNGLIMPQGKSDFLLKIFTWGKQHRLLIGILLPVLFHFVVVLWYVIVRDVSIMADPILNSWDSFWQHIPLAVLREKPLESLFYLHAQPPLFNFIGMIMDAVFGDFFLKILHFSHIVLGSLMCGMFFFTIFVLTNAYYYSLVVSLLVALNPSLFLYEAFPMYMLLSAFFVMTCIFFITLYHRYNKTRYLFLSAITSVLLVLLQSFFHIVFLFLLFVLIGVMAPVKTRKLLFFVLIVLFCIPLSLYLKNVLIYNFFGSTSWTGSNLWRIASAGYSEGERIEMFKDGIIEEAAACRDVFDKPSAFIKFGYDKKSDILLLGNDDYHNINMVDISRMHGKNAVRVILNDYTRYLKNVWNAYYIFCRLSYETRPLQANKMRLHPIHITINEIFHGTFIMRKIGKGGIMQSTSLYVIAFPLFLFLLACKFVRDTKFSFSRMLFFIQMNVGYIIMALFVLYVVSVSILFEYGENARFKFPIIMPTQCCLFSLFNSIFKSFPRDHSE